MNKNIKTPLIIIAGLSLLFLSVFYGDFARMVRGAVYNKIAEHKDNSDEWNHKNEVLYKKGNWIVSNKSFGLRLSGTEIRSNAYFAKSKISKAVNTLDENYGDITAHLEYSCAGSRDYKFSIKFSEDGATKPPADEIINMETVWGDDTVLIPLGGKNFEDSSVKLIHRASPVYEPGKYHPKAKDTSRTITTEKNINKLLKSKPAVLFKIKWGEASSKLNFNFRLWGARKAINFLLDKCNIVRR